jgi:hypothetical protein
MVHKPLALAATLALGLAGIGLAAPTYAQDGPPPGLPGMEAPGPEGSPGGREMRRPGADIDARLAYLKAKLKITEAQTPQWNALADVLKARAARMDGKMDEMRKARDNPGTAIDQLERRREMMANASADLDEILKAAKPLYAALDPEQKKTADEMVRPHHRGRGGHPPL